MLIYCIFFLLLSNAVTLRRDKSILYSRKAITMMIYCLIIILNIFNILFLESSLGLYGGLFYVNSITQFFHMFIFLICAVILQLTGFYPRKIWHLNYSKLYEIFSYKLIYNNTNIINKMGQQYKIIEYPLILLFIITGGIFLISCSDIVSIFLSIELQSYGLYLLSTIYRNSELSTSAGLTYFLLGGLSSCFILLGTSLLYANYGTTNLDAYYILNNVSNNNCDYEKYIDLSKPFYLNTSLVIMLVGFLFKISAAPFHFWSPDVYDAIPTVVTTFVAIVAKISILIFLLGFTYYINSTNEYYNWKYALLVSCFLSLIIGTVLGLTQSRIKRLFAYSTISHLGFILLALSIGTLESIESFIFYLIQYTISNLNAFILLITIGYSLYIYVNDEDSKDKCKNLLDRDYSPIQLISQLSGYFHINPILALSLAITLFSFVGIPPLIGFFAKQLVLSAALDKGYIFLAILAILTSVISAVYYLAVVKQIFFDENQYKVNENIENLQFSAYLSPLIFSFFFKNKKHKLTNKTIKFNGHNVKISSFFSTTISVLTLAIMLFIYEPVNILNTGLILSHLMIDT